MSASGTATRLEARSELRFTAGDLTKKSLGRDGDCFCWQQQDIPVRLLPSDLPNPKDFHRRLSDWLMQQR